MNMNTEDGEHWVVLEEKNTIKIKQNNFIAYVTMEEVELFHNQKTTIKAIKTTIEINGKKHDEKICIELTNEKINKHISEVRNIIKFQKQLKTMEFIGFKKLLSIKPWEDESTSKT